MNILEIARQRTVIDGKHESLFRCYHILQLVKDLIEAGTPTGVILRIVADIESQDPAFANEAGSDEAAGNWAAVLRKAMKWPPINLYTPNVKLDLTLRDDVEETEGNAPTEGPY